MEESAIPRRAGGLGVDARAIDAEPLEPVYVQKNEYGMLGQVLKTLSPDAGDRVMLDNVLGSPIRAWNDRGFASRFVYDALQRPSQHRVKPGAGSEQLVTLQLYGEVLANAANDNLRGKLYRTYDSAGAVTAEAYDFKGNLLRQSRRLAEDYTTTPDWSDLADEATLTDIETAANALLESETFTTETGHDALGRVTTVTTPDGSETANTYDAGGRLLTVKSKLRGAGTATDFVDAIAYDAKGQRLRIELANGTTTAYTYDPDTFRVVRIKTERSGPNAATMQDLLYSYDPVGNIVEIRDHAQQTVYFNNAVVSPTQRYWYDAIYRLVEATGRERPNGQPDHHPLVPSVNPPPNDGSVVFGYTEKYTYDQVGNILKMQHLSDAPNMGWTRHYQYQYQTPGPNLPPCNRLVATSMPGDPANGPYSATYPHDAHGNMTAMPHLPGGLAWDYADRLQKTDGVGDGVTYYLYDADGQRVRKVHVNQAGTIRKQRLYFGSWETYREHKNINTTNDLDLERETLHVHDDHGRVCLIETKTVETGSPVVSPANVARYEYSNHLGTTNLELDGNADIISYEEFHPYGTSSYRAANSAIEVSEKRYRYTGQERDEETGLAYHGARYYAPWLARWTAADPIGLGDGPNRYLYARGNPVTYLDRGGEASEPGFFARAVRRLNSAVDAMTGRPEATTRPPTMFSELDRAQRAVKGAQDFVPAVGAAMVGAQGEGLLAAAKTVGRSVVAAGEAAVRTVPYMLAATKGLAKGAAVGAAGAGLIAAGVAVGGAIGGGIAAGLLAGAAVVSLATGGAQELGRAVRNIATGNATPQDVEVVSEPIGAAAGGAGSLGFLRSKMTPLRFEPGYEAHISDVDPTVPRSRGIGGAHNVNNFNREAAKLGVKVVSERPFSPVAGVKQIEYRLPARDKTGKPTGEFQAQILSKTVYDPAVIPDAVHLQMGQEAARSARNAAWLQGRSRLPREWLGTTSKGIKMQGYSNAKGEVTSFFVHTPQSN